MGEVTIGAGIPESELNVSEPGEFQQPRPTNWEIVNSYWERFLASRGRGDSPGRIKAVIEHAALTDQALSEQGTSEIESVADDLEPYIYNGAIAYAAHNRLRERLFTPGEVSVESFQNLLLVLVARRTLQEDIDVYAGMRGYESSTPPEAGLWMQFIKAHQIAAGEVPNGEGTKDTRINAVSALVGILGEQKLVTGLRSMGFPDTDFSPIDAETRDSDVIAPTRFGVPLSFDVKSSNGQGLVMAVTKTGDVKFRIFVPMNSKENHPYEFSPAQYDMLFEVVGGYGL